MLPGCWFYHPNSPEGSRLVYFLMGQESVGSAEKLALGQLVPGGWYRDLLSSRSVSQWMRGRVLFDALANYSAKSTERFPTPPDPVVVSTVVYLKRNVINLHELSR